jgi:hypothetical protein
VRIFLFGNANNFGTQREVETGLWTFTFPPALDDRYRRQLDAMFRAFADQSMFVIPSLVDFHVAAQLSGVGGRPDIVQDPFTRERFFNMVLEPFLTISEAYSRSSLFTWEVMNEPSNVISWPIQMANPFTNHPIAPEVMADFLQKACDRIRGHNGLSSTVGHRYAKYMDSLPSGTMKQFHYYPQASYLGPFVENTLPPVVETAAFIGEFAAATWNGDHGALWPDEEIPASEQQDTKTRVLARLRHIESKGYRLALIWPEADGSFDAADPSNEPLKLSRDAQDAIKAYH